MTTVCKVSCTNKNETTHTVTFTTMYDPNLPEDQRFSNATPWGELKAVVDNEKAFNSYVVGNYYYLKLEPIE